ncbi:hypothetical protein IQ244_27770 [Nostoc sp. LEGE 06077]|uniref:hypothetical protein n=1 Tax=Nostoc sp. LEGE 06077 TaxID=915325 RepID=UPI00187E2D92|nr:hypothetical protein [Nostoc sp. LEGE 06077]MBE9210228.1 hypothetical protein [Nostoc sp. LEGE 06077]
MSRELFLKIEELYVRATLADYKHPYDLAKAIEEIANIAWDAVDEHLEYLNINNSTE